MPYLKEEFREDSVGVLIGNALREGEQSCMVRHGIQDTANIHQEKVGERIAS